MTGPNTRDAEALSGAIYFIVGRGTEGGAASYRLSIAGISNQTWGDPTGVIDNSGYSIGTIQVDLGQRGTWGLGQIDGHVTPGQTTYVDGLIEQSANYARTHGLSFPENSERIRSDLLTHGNGLAGRSTLSFIDAGTRDSINAWASSESGKQWVNANVDYPQVRNATASAIDILDRSGKNITDDRRLETVAILAKTANQYPSQMGQFRTVLENGGTYEDVLDTALRIKSHHSSYAGPEAAAIAERYKSAFQDPERASTLERAQSKVASSSFDPSTESTDPDIREALRSIGQRGRAPAAEASDTLRLGAHGSRVSGLQSQLAELDVTDAREHPLSTDGNFGPSTQAAVEKFQAAHGMAVDGIVGRRTEAALQHEVEKARQTTIMSLADERHPGVSLYHQALNGVRSIDAERGRASDQASCHLAGSLAVAACSTGMSRIDHVAMSDDGARAYAIQGDLNSPFKRYTEVDVAHSVAVPLEQSGAYFVRAAHEQAQQQSASQPQQVVQQQEAPAPSPVMQR